ncbi:hypothetical protein HOB87_15285 [Candidatus Woesearchaeota archaeon]|jgi:hypothetical protein|nr:hypothetical protein [Candidatus Woesearchaeota archaeon]
MCISAEEWKFINTFAPWLSAIGTLLAVAVSLYISYSTRKIALTISSGTYVFNENGIDEEYLAIYVTNIGIGYKYIDANKSSNFPCRLGENETAHLFVKIENDEGNWLRNFRDEYLKKYWLSTLRIVVYPNVGKPFKVKPDKTIIKELRYS